MEAFSELHGCNIIATHRLGTINTAYIDTVLSENNAHPPDERYTPQGTDGGANSPNSHTENVVTANRYPQAN
jgi:hypothetical protein